MLHHFGTGDKIILPRQQRRIRGVERIVIVHHHPRLAQHTAQGRSGTAAVIEPFHAGLQPRQQRFGQLRQERPIAGIGRIVIMLIIDRLFAGTIQMRGGIGADQFALRTTEKTSAPIRAEEVGGMTA